MFVHGVDEGIQEQDPDDFAFGIEQFICSQTDLAFIDRYQAVARRQVDIALVAAATQAFADAEDVLGIDQWACVAVQLLVQGFGLRLAEVSQSAFHHRDVFEPAGDDQADLAAVTGEHRVEHAGTAIDVGRAGSVHIAGFETQSARRIGDRITVTARLFVAPTDRFTDREGAVRFDQNRVGHRTAGIEGENELALAASGGGSRSHRLIPCLIGFAGRPAPTVPCLYVIEDAVVAGLPANRKHPRSNPATGDSL